MKKLVLTLAIAIMAPAVAGAEVLEAIVARVGDRIITRSQYASRLRDGVAEIERNVPGAEQASRKQEFRKNLLNEMLSELLIKDRADRLGLTVTPNEVQDAVNRLKAQYGIKSDAEFEESLKQSGLTRADMEARLRDTLITNKVFSRELRGRADLTDKELRERYEREKEQYRLPERAKVRELVVVVPEDANPESRASLRKQAEEAYNRAKAGEEFAALVANYSSAPSKESGGDLGVIARGELAPPLDTGVFTADAGAVVGPVETRFGYHILFVEQRIASETPAFDAVKDQLRKDVGEEAYRRDYQAYIERLRAEAYVQIHEANLPSA